MSGSGRADLLAAAERLASAVKNHAEVLVEQSDSVEAVIPAENKLRAEAWAYVQEILTLTNWGNPFGNLEDEDSLEDPNEHSESETPAKAKSAVVVNLEARYRLRLHDLRKTAEFVRERRRVRGQGAYDDEDPAPADLATALFTLDGWEPFAYPQDIIEVLDQKWETAPER